MAIWRISFKTLKELELTGKEIDRIPVRGVNSESEQGVYIISEFILPNLVMVTNINVICGDIGESGDILIGMDIITLGDFTITNDKSETQFTFSIPPHYNKIDFVKRSEKLNKSKRSL
ncbi:MAG: hypothetical protein AAF975_07000 [Spirochaetota bacterium]